MSNGAARKVFTGAIPGLDRFFRGVTWLWAGIFAAGTVASVVWFIRMLHGSGLRVSFGHA